MKRTYRCSGCNAVGVRTSEEMKDNGYTKGRVPAFILCGRCYSETPIDFLDFQIYRSVRMWGDDIPEEDRNEKKYDDCGLEWVLKITE